MPVRRSGRVALVELRLQDGLRFPGTQSRLAFLDRHTPEIIRFRDDLHVHQILAVGSEGPGENGAIRVQHRYRFAAPVGTHGRQPLLILKYNEASVGSPDRSQDSFSTESKARHRIAFE